MKPELKAPGGSLLKLKHDGPLSNFAFNFNLCRYSTDAYDLTSPRADGRDVILVGRPPYFQPSILVPCL
jgi:hypothetical protein